MGERIDALTGNLNKSQKIRVVTGLGAIATGMALEVANAFNGSEYLAWGSLGAALGGGVLALSAVIERT